jgi:excinuclease ABC subunit C
MPNLIIIDGGSGQVNSALMALNSLNLKIPMIGLAKENEEIYKPDTQSSLKLDKNSRIMLLIRQIRDATHDFSLGYNRKCREMQIRDEFKQQKNDKII